MPRKTNNQANEEQKKSKTKETKKQLKDLLGNLLAPKKKSRGRTRKIKPNTKVSFEEVLVKLFELSGLKYTPIETKRPSLAKEIAKAVKREIEKIKKDKEKSSNISQKCIKTLNELNLDNVTNFRELENQLSKLKQGCSSNEKRYEKEIKKVAQNAKEVFSINYEQVMIKKKYTRYLIDLLQEIGSEESRVCAAWLISAVSYLVYEFASDGVDWFYDLIRAAIGWDACPERSYISAPLAYIEFSDGNVLAKLECSTDELRIVVGEVLRILISDLLPKT